MITEVKNNQANETCLRNQRIALGPPANVLSAVSGFSSVQGTRGAALVPGSWRRSNSPFRHSTV